MKYSDSVLVKRSKAGDRSAFGELYERYRIRIFRICYLIVKNHECAEEITQEVFLKALTHIDKFRGEAFFVTWLVRIAINQSLYFLSKNKYKLVSLADVIINEELGEIPLQFGKKDAHAELTPERLTFIRIFHGLSQFDQEIIFLNRVEGYELQEIANIFSCGVSKIKSRLRRSELLLLRKFNSIGKSLKANGAQK